MKIKEFAKKYKLAILIVFIIDLIAVDPIPWVDEAILGILSIYGWA